MIRLGVFGSLSVATGREQDDDRLLDQPKVMALLVYLVLARPRGFHQRDRLVGLFWPELDQEHARSALRGLLRRLRTAAGKEAFDTRGDELIRVVRDVVWCDAVAFDEAVAEDRLGEALDLYADELLPSFKPPESGSFDHWLESERSYYKERAKYAALELVQRYVASNQLTNASQLARVVARLAKHDERILRRVMTLLAKLGDRAGAIQLYSRFCNELWKDLELRPSDETVKLAEEIRTRSRW